MQVIYGYVENIEYYNQNMSMHETYDDYAFSKCIYNGSERVHIDGANITTYNSVVSNTLEANPNIT